MSRPPRIWISNETPEKDEIVRVRAQIVHVMESGFRLDANGDPIPADVLTGFTATTERLWQEVRPLYLALHTYVRGKLNEKYGDAVQPATVQAWSPGLMPES